MKEIVSFQEGLYKYELPAMPPEREIWYHELPKKQQYWKTPYAKNFKWLTEKGEMKNVKNLSEIDKRKYIDYWRDKWQNGLWFMNNGEPTYITGAHVDHIAINKFSNNHLKYFDEQRYRFYFRDLTNKDPLCDGRVWQKPRRAGSTFEEKTEAIRCVLSGFGYNVAMQSTKVEVANRTLMIPIIDVYMSRPMWMREKFYSNNGRKPRKSLQLTPATISKEEDEDPSLGGYIMAVPTVASATDADEWVLVIMDEFSKWETCDPYEAFEVSKKAASNPGKRGKIDAISTTGDTKDAVRATISWHKLISQSNPLIRDQNGKTVSGLYPYFISAIHSHFVSEELDKLGKKNTDQYGFVNREMSEEWIWNEIRKYPVGTKEYIYALYKLPLKKEHTLLSSATTNVFSKIRINERLTELEAMLPQDKPYIRGMLEEDSYGKVWFVSDAERRKLAGGADVELGIWLWATQPYFSAEKGIDMRNRFRMINGVYFPYRQAEGAIGYDPINYTKNQTTSNHLSMAAIVVKKKFDYVHKEDDPEYLASTFMGLCVFRPDDPRDANKEVIKAAKFTGYSVMHERSVNHTYEDFEAAGMLPFLLRDPKTVGDLKSKPYGISPSDIRTKKDGLAMLQARYALPKDEKQIDEIKAYPFEDGLRNLYNFDFDNTTPFDITMAELYAEWGLKLNMFTNQAEGNDFDLYRLLQEINPKRA